MRQWPLSGYVEDAEFGSVAVGLTSLPGPNQVDAACKYVDIPS